MNKKLKKNLTLAVKIIFIIFTISYFEWYGLATLGVYYIVFGLYRLFFVRFDDFIRTKQLIETMIWGKPLGEFKKNELKHHKVKIVWSKKNE